MTFSGAGICSGCSMNGRVYDSLDAIPISFSLKAKAFQTPLQILLARWGIYNLERKIFCVGEFCLKNTYNSRYTHNFTWFLYQCVYCRRLLVQYPEGSCTVIYSNGRITGTDSWSYFGRSAITDVRSFYCENCRCRLYVYGRRFYLSSGSGESHPKWQRSRWLKVYLRLNRLLRPAILNFPH